MAKPYRSTLSAPLSIKDNEVCNKVGTLLENLTDDAIAELYVTKCSAISRYLMELYVTKSFAIASSVNYSEIRQYFSIQCRDQICIG